MTVYSEARLAFAGFLDRLATGDDADWEQYIATHYADKFLEELRRCVMRLRHYSTVAWNEHDSRDMLLHWAHALRLSFETEQLSGIECPDVTVTLTASEFVVLDSMLRRLTETDTLTVNDEAERQMLYNLKCLCEKYARHTILPDIQVARLELSGEGSSEVA
jgi:hypothetical protein